jgi:serine/threonine protein kinase
MEPASSNTRLIGAYLALVPLARGGMGEVWIAISLAETDPRRVCLVKTVKSSLSNDDETRRRFVDEAEVALRLYGDHLCHVFDAGGVDDELFLAMELIEGLTFKRLNDQLAAARRALSVDEAVALAVGMLRGLHEAHTAVDPGSGRPLGVVHRDVSPHNVMVDREGRIKIIDFGLATSVVKQTMTESAVVLGKTAYMAPEQARGDDTTPATDQYAAAIVLYELLTGDRFYGEMPSRAIWSVVGAGQHRPRSMERVPGALRSILVRALAPTPAKRFPSCGAFADALAHALPAAVAPATLAQLGALVSDLSRSEQELVASARAQAAALLPAASAGLEDATRSMTLHVPGGGLRASLREAPEGTGATSAVPRDGRTQPPAAPLPPRRRHALIAALAGIAAAVAVSGVAAVVVARRTAPPAPPAVVVAPTTTPTATTPPLMPTATTPTAPTPTAPTPTATTPPLMPTATTPTATTPTATTPPLMPTATTPTAPTPTAPTTSATTASPPPRTGPGPRVPPAGGGATAVDVLREKFRALKQRCGKPCVDAGLATVDRSLPTAQSLYDRCVERCRSTP